MSTLKSFSTETSERYSRALFELTNETNELEKVENDIISFQMLLNSSQEIQNFIKDPTQSISQQNKVVNLLKNEGFYINDTQKDLANNDRCIVGVKK